jgi:hypothetical protein
MTTFLLARNETHAVPLFSLEVERCSGLGTSANATFRCVRPARWRIVQERLAQLADRLADILVLLEPIEQSGVAHVSDISSARLFHTSYDGAVRFPRATRQHKSHRDDD